MRGLASITFTVALAACAATPHTQTSSPLVASYDLDAHTMLPIVYEATHAQNYRVAVVDPAEGNARFVMVPRSGGAPIVVHVATRSVSVHRFASCVGACSTSISVTSRNADDANARDLFAAIDARAQSARLDH
jgi:hypothetical protein